MKKKTFLALTSYHWPGETLEPKFSVQTGQVYPVLDAGHSHAFRYPDTLTRKWNYREAIL